MAETKKTVESPCSAYEALEERWKLPRALRGGTTAMREAGDEYLPRAEGEKDAAFEERLGRSFLYGGYEDTVSGLASKPFSRVVTVSDGLDPRLDPILENADNAHTSLTDFARDVLDDATDRGLSHILVDFSATRPARNAKEEQEQGARPYFLHIRADNLIGWKPIVLDDGRPALGQIRVKSKHVVPGEGFEEVKVERVRVWNFSYVKGRPGSWEVWEKREGQEAFALTKSGTYTYIGNPLVTLYTRRTGFMAARPALEPLSEMSLAHWQSYSDQRHILRAARVPMIARTGVTKEEKDAGFVLSTSQSFSSSKDSAKFYWVELQSGVGLEHGWKDLQQLEDHMEVLGLQPLIKRTGSTTATEREIDAHDEECDLQAWARRLEAALTRAYRIAGEMIGAPPAEDWKGVTVFKEFGISSRAGRYLDWLLKARIAGEISRGRFLKEAQDLDAIGADTKLDEEERAIEKEAEKNFTDLTGGFPGTSGGGGSEEGAE